MGSQIDMKRQLEEARTALNSYSRQSSVAPAITSSSTANTTHDGVQQERMQDQPRIQMA
eukprot:CAMPEP_0173073406 /NCGR_PEP_ID=MMETSP1102-20130122/10391_1 /TAXON_ID=49646 /ORGANISM="Geminigera sp., Strain Caron Lab Isolate" /LENGTH=58 /DNA_ID=CAMNT_0013942255 /DNA_START=50 /DNA_END=226 /DNA_ORIENTATION=-